MNHKINRFLGKCIALIVMLLAVTVFRLSWAGAFQKSLRGEIFREDGALLHHSSDTVEPKSSVKQSNGNTNSISRNCLPKHWMKPSSNQVDVEKIPKYTPSEWLDFIRKNVKSSVRFSVKDKDAYFESLRYGGQAVSIGIVMGSGTEKTVKYLVDQIGKHGGDVDTQLYFTLTGYRDLPHTTSLPVRYPRHGAMKEMRSDEERYREMFYRKHEEYERVFCESVVRRAFRDRQFLKSYHHFVIWENTLFKPDYLALHIGQAARGIEKAKGHVYWFYGRQFVLFSYATCRDDLLDTYKPENLHDMSRKWHEWYKSNGMYLRSIPDVPRWKLDEGEKTRQEAFLPFLLSDELPRLKLPINPAGSRLDVNKPR